MYTTCSTKMRTSDKVLPVSTHFLEGKGTKIEGKVMTDRYKKGMTWGKGVSILAKKRKRKSKNVLYGRPQARLRGGRDLRRQIRLCQRHILCLGPAAATMALFLLN